MFSAWIIIVSDLEQMKFSNSNHEIKSIIIADTSRDYCMILVRYIKKNQMNAKCFKG